MIKSICAAVLRLVLLSMVFPGSGVAYRFSPTWNLKAVAEQRVKLLEAL